MFIEQPIKKKTSNRRLIQGVGINDADYVVSYLDCNNQSKVCPYYKVWTNMLQRCFSNKSLERRPSYTGCTLEESWKTFSNFKNWMKGQDWVGKALDKDLLSFSNKHYGPDTCLFISHELNNLLTLRNRDRGEYPLGVSKTTINKQDYYVASCSFYGIQKRLGYYKTVEDAANRYKEEKLKYIRKLADAEVDPRIQRALLSIK